MTCSSCESSEGTVDRSTIRFVFTIYKRRLCSCRGSVFKIDDTVDTFTTHHQVFITVVVEICKSNLKSFVYLIKWEAIVGVYIINEGVARDLTNVSKLTNVSNTTCLSLQSTVVRRYQRKTVEE